MPDSPPVYAPAGFVNETAVAFADAAARSVVVSDAAPLPTRPTIVAATSTPLAGSTSAGAVLGPFQPQLGRAIWVTLSGTWTGTVAVQRSTDGGTTRLPLTVAGEAWAAFAGNVQEPVGEETAADATWWLAATLTGGTLTYRVAQ